MSFIFDFSNYYLKFKFNSSLFKDFIFKLDQKAKIVNSNSNLKCTINCMKIKIVLVSNSSCLSRVIYTTFFVHVQVVINFVLVHLFVFVFLHHFEMGVFVMGSPVRGLHFSYPLFTARLKLRLFNLFFAFGQPVVDMREIVRFKSSVHHFHSIPRDIAT